MTLRAQLLLIGLLILALPLSGWQFARQVERTLRAGHAQALEVAAETAARQLADQGAIRWPDVTGTAIYVHQPDSSPFLDGYADDWSGFLDAASPARLNSTDLQPVQVNVAERGNALHLLFEVRSDQQIYSTPGRSDGDRLQLRFERDDGLRGEVELAPLAPGFIETRGRNPQGWPRVQGYWQPGARGWTVELQLPESTQVQRVGWTVIDARSKDNSLADRQINSEGELHLLRSRPDLAEQLESVLPNQTKAWIALPSAWVVAYAERGRSPELSQAAPSWIDTVLFEGLASDSISAGPIRDANTIRIEPAAMERSNAPEAPATSTWSTRPNQPGVMLTAQAPIIQAGQRLGTLILEREADQLLLDSNRAVLRLLGITLAVFIIVALILLGYATWLSERIRRLRDGLELSIAEDGQVRQALRPSRRGDELGDLGRSVSRILARLREHQNYLRTLADKLAHELRTPLAMIRSSLDNLEAVDDPTAIKRYRDRASEGSDRLNRIFQAMSQAARIEESLGHEDFESLDMDEFLSHYLAACQDTYPARRFRMTTSSKAHIARAAPDLLAQLMDKLIDNAVDFSPADSTIRLRLRNSAGKVELDIENDGPPLPEASDTLFDSMVSIRNKKGPSVHLGLGLSIVRLIAEHHQGSVQASNIGTGVRFRLQLPRGDLERSNSA